MINKIIKGDCVQLMRELPDEFVDLTVTSPPYDDLRKYKGYCFDFESTARELFRITKTGGVLVWIIGDRTINGSETLTSFKQALFFKEIGFNIHDTMIYKKHSPFPPNIRYWQTFEYMFILSKGKPKTFNPILQPKTYANSPKSTSYRKKDGNIEKTNQNAADRLEKANEKTMRIADNIWDIAAGYMKSTTDKIAYEHPAIFPEELAQKHILSWSNKGDIVFDPFAGSGTTLKMAMLNDRNYLGFETSDEYVEIAQERLNIYRKEGVTGV